MAGPAWVQTDSTPGGPEMQPANRRILTLRQGNGG